MEFGDGNGEHVNVVDGIEEQAFNETADNDSCAVDLELSGLEYQLNIVAVQKFQDSLSM
ncbi:hypothetical protein TSUD_121500 [Trifolium subterraneum]|nr:hypothetical protein TSUD_121500 [Trifolium subterraneum]